MWASLYLRDNKNQGSTGSHYIPEDCMVWFQDHNSWAVSFMSHKRLPLHVATTVTQKLPTELLEKLTAYLCHIIHLHQNHHLSLRKNPSLFQYADQHYN